MERRVNVVWRASEWMINVGRLDAKNVNNSGVMGMGVTGKQEENVRVSLNKE